MGSSVSADQSDRRAPRLSPLADALLSVGLVSWVAAQFMPAYTTPSIFSNEPPSSPMGLAATLFGWSLAVVFGPAVHVSGPIALAWVSNVLLLGALLARKSRRSGPAVTLGLVALLFATLGVSLLVVFAGALLSFEIGTWVWIASMAVAALGIVVWAAVLETDERDWSQGPRGRRSRDRVVATPARR